MAAPSSDRPNVLLVVVDDLGYSDIEPYGAEISTPVLQALADRGVSFTRFHTSSLCGPSRAMMLTGCDNHQVGLGVMFPIHAMNQYMQPGYEGYLNDAAPTMAELLRDAGYQTFMSGKWHLGKTDESRPAAKGFQRSFAFLGGGASHFDDALPLTIGELPQTLYVDDDRDVTRELPADFYSTTYYVDRMIDYLRDRDADAPFFGYLSFTAPHDPIQVPDAWLDRYAGAYDGGYDSIKTARLERMKQIGLIDEDLGSNPGSGMFTEWHDLDQADRRVEARKMELYASMIEMIDHELGRLLDDLDQRGELDNTIVVFLSDNGANPKHPWGYPPNTEESINRDFDNSYENLGRKGSFISIGGAWAEVAGTPLSYFKYTTYQGGIQTPLIMAGGPLTRRGIERSELLHIADLLPTLLDIVGVDRPDATDGRTAAPLYGRSMAPVLTSDAPPVIRGEADVLCFEMDECKSVVTPDGWKLVRPQPPYGGDGSSWQLFNLDDDPSELSDLAAEMPDRVAELVAEWEAYAEFVGYIESDGTSVMRVLGPQRAYEFRLGDD